MPKGVAKLNCTVSPILSAKISVDEPAVGSATRSKKNVSARAGRVDITFKKIAAISKRFIATRPWQSKKLA